MSQFEQLAELKLSMDEQLSEIMKIVRDTNQRVKTLRLTTGEDKRGGSATYRGSVKKKVIKFVAKKDGYPKKYPNNYIKWSTSDEAKNMGRESMRANVNAMIDLIGEEHVNIENENKISWDQLINIDDPSEGFKKKQKKNPDGPGKIDTDVTKRWTVTNEISLIWRGMDDTVKAEIKAEVDELKKTFAAREQAYLEKYPSEMERWNDWKSLTTKTVREEEKNDDQAEPTEEAEMPKKAHKRTPSKKLASRGGKASKKLEW